MNKRLSKIWHSKYVQFFVPDKLYLSVYFKRRFGYKINWKNPVTFNEKIQWLKLYDRNKEYIKIVDKLQVRDYIKENVGNEYNVKIIGIYDSINDIDYDKLPDKFVLKTTHDSGSVVICKDKKKFNIKKANRKLKKSLKRNYYYLWREWPYKHIKRKIICEEYLEDMEHKSVYDYKVMCFNSEPKVIQVCADRHKKGGVKFAFYDKDWNVMDVKRTKHRRLYKEIEKPAKLDELLDIAGKLSQGFRFVRVDCYIVGDKVYCGELTLYPASGLEGFEPEEYDKVFGQWLELDNIL